MEAKLSMQSWWSVLWKKSALEQSQSELEREIASLEQQIDALWQEIQQTILRYLANLNDKIANIKYRHEQTLNLQSNLQSIDSFVWCRSLRYFMMGASERDTMLMNMNTRHKVTLTRDS